MKEKLRFSGTFKCRSYKYYYEATSSNTHDVNRYKPYYRYIAHKINEELLQELDYRLARNQKHKIAPNFNKMIRVGFSTQATGNGILDTHSESLLMGMEEKPVPPRHIWDKEFTSHMYFRAVIHHKVRLDKKEKLRRYRPQDMFNNMFVDEGYGYPDVAALNYGVIVDSVSTAAGTATGRFI